MGSTRRIAIVGAGLGGLAAAIALRRQGFEVDIYEQAPELAEFGAGINISPNSVKFFHAVGLADRLHAVASEPIGLTWRDWGSDTIHNCLPFIDFEKRYGARYYVVHRSDLHRLLSEALPQDIIHLGKRCTRAETRNGSAGLSFADGDSAEADVVVGCDGIRSAVRASVFGGEGPRYAGTMCWRALAPTDALPKDFHDRHVNQWSGEGGFIISYYIRQDKFINFVCVRQQPGWTEQSWSVPSSVEEMLASFPLVGDKLRRMMSEATSCSKWGQFTGEHAAQWTRGRVTLLGDSAHAMLATFGQGANMAFEDAYVLSRWLRANADDADAALAGYEAVRKPRATRVQQLSRTEVRFKRQHSSWERLHRELVFMSRYGSTTSGVYRWIFGYDPVAQWQGS
jgi:2-polyprenyl-6-methoxyphenol hydroxylase-like FAD-dependent oxidoreductase